MENTEQPNPQPQDGEAMLMSYLRAVLECTVRGAAAALVLIPSEKVMLKLCGMMGHIAGELVQKDHGSTIAFRRACKDEFENMLRAVPINASITAPPKPPIVQRAPTPPLEEGMVRKGGQNQGDSQITERPDPPGAITHA